MARKIKQIAFEPLEDGDSSLWALADDGSLWCYQFTTSVGWEWKRTEVPNLPDDETPIESVDRISEKGGV